MWLAATDAWEYVPKLTLRTGVTCNPEQAFRVPGFWTAVSAMPRLSQSEIFDCLIDPEDVYYEIVRETIVVNPYNLSPGVIGANFYAPGGAEPLNTN